MKPTRNSRTSTRLLGATALAASQVVSDRLLGLADPAAFGSRRQQREIQRMFDEKSSAAFAGWFAAASEMMLMPMRLAAFAWRAPMSISPGAEPWTSIGNLWLGVGNAAMRPVHRAVVANRKRLSRARNRTRHGR